MVILISWVQFKGLEKFYKGFFYVGHSRLRSLFNFAAEAGPKLNLRIFFFHFLSQKRS